jgi:hypothetical protein
MAANVKVLIGRKRAFQPAKVELLVLRVGNTNDPPLRRNRPGFSD